MTSTKSVYFCLACEDQSPWLSDDRMICPSCLSIESVTEANRFGNLEGGGR